MTLALWMLPLMGIVSTAIRSQSDLLFGNSGAFRRGSPFIDNLLEVFHTAPMGRLIVNSIAVTAITVLACLALGTLAGFALAKYKFLAAPGSSRSSSPGISSGLPNQILMIPVRNMMVSFGA